MFSVTDSYLDDVVALYHTTQPFYGPFYGTTWVSQCQRELLDFMVQGKINRGRHVDHQAGRQSIRTNQCPPLRSPHEAAS